MTLDAIIIGGGFSGLTAGYFAHRRGLDFVVLEKSAQVGGVLGSECVGGYLLERSANTLLHSPLLEEMLEDLNLQNRVIFSKDVVKQRFIYLEGKLCPIPSSPLSVLGSPLLSLRHKFQLMYGLLFKTAVQSEQTIQAFFQYYCGDYFTENFVDAMVSGIWAGDIRKLSMDACFSSLKQNTLQHRSLLQALKKSHRYKSSIFSFKNGTSELINALIKRCQTSIQVNQCVTSISADKEKGGFQVMVGDNHYHAKQVIICTPIHQLPALFKSHLSALDYQSFNDLCQSIVYAPLHLVYSSFKRGAINTKYLDGFGFLVPSNQDKKILGSIFNSSLFENRAPDDEVLLTTFIGGEHFQEISDLSTSAIYDIVNQELREVLDIKNAPIWQHHIAWQQAVPQYHLGHQRKIEHLQSIINNPNIIIHANWHNGTALPKIVEKSSLIFHK